MIPALEGHPPIPVEVDAFAYVTKETIIRECGTSCGQVPTCAHIQDLTSRLPYGGNIQEGTKVFSIVYDILKKD